MSLDATDLRLLEILQEDASLSNLELAVRAHVSPATALRRVRLLRRLPEISTKSEIKPPPPRRIPRVDSAPPSP